MCSRAVQSLRDKGLFPVGPTLQGLSSTYHKAQWKIKGLRYRAPLLAGRDHELASCAPDSTNNMIIPLWFDLIYQNLPSEWGKTQKGRCIAMQAVIRDYLEKVKVGRKQSHRNLVVFPLLSGYTTTLDYMEVMPWW